MRARRMFFSLLALRYLVAFASLGVQLEGLFGAGGIVPVGESRPANSE